MKSFEKIKNCIKNIKEILKKNKDYLFKIILWGQFTITIVMSIMLIYSLNKTANLSKQINDISIKYDSIICSINSTDTPSEVKTETDDKSTSTSTSASSSNSNSTSTSASSNSTSSTSSTSTSSTTTSNTTTKPDSSTTVAVGTSTDLDLLACVIYQEAGGNGSCDTCRRRVADVVLNRVADPRFPNTIEGVLTAKNQYGRFYYTGVVWPSRHKNAGEQAAVARAYRIAEEVLSGQHSELYGNGYIWQAGFKQGTSQIYCCGHYYGK